MGDERQEPELVKHRHLTYWPHRGAGHKRTVGPRTILHL